MIISQDDNYIFINKPFGMLSIPDRFNAELPSVVGYLRLHFPEIFIVHRIDRDTSGLMVFAKNAAAHRHASMLFEGRGVTKKYLAIVNGTLPANEGTIENNLTDHPVIKGKVIVHAKLGKKAITNFKVIETFGSYSLVQFHILTGRMHQIRVHAQNMGNPVLCDPIYGRNEDIKVSMFKKKYKLEKYQEEEKAILNRLALHSYSMSFIDENGKEQNAEAPLFKDMDATIKQMRKWLK